MRGGLPTHELWTVPWRHCTPLDGGHPQSRERTTDSATVQGHPGHSSVWDPGGTNNGNDISGRLLMIQCFFVSNTLKGITKVQVPWVQNTKPCVTGRANI